MPTPPAQQEVSAMQELIEWLKKEKDSWYKSGYDDEVHATQQYISKATELLDKEREQIVNAFDGGKNEFLKTPNKNGKDYFEHHYSQP